MQKVRADDTMLLMLAGVLLLVGGVLPGCTSDDTPTAPAAESQQPAQAADTAARPPAAPPTRTDQGRSVEERVEDASLAARVKMALAEDRRLRTFDFEPRVTEGQVTLAGNVGTRDQGKAAAEVAAAVEGVDEVLNRLTVDGEQVAWNTSGKGSSEQTASSTGSSAGGRGGATRGGRYHTVQSGESLWAIANQYGLSVSRLRELNNLSSNNLQAGERLLVSTSDGSSDDPSLAEASTQPQNTSPQPQSAGTQSQSARASSGGPGGEGASSGSTSAEQGEKAAEYYVVKRGESLWAIAQKNDMTVSQLKQLNDLTSNDLMPGDRLRVE